MGGVPSFEDKEEVYCTVLHLINVLSTDQVRKKKKNPDGLNRWDGFHS